MPPKTLIGRVRWLFLLLGLLNAVFIFPVLASSAAGRGTRVLAAVSLTLLTVYWVRGYRRERFSTAMVPLEGAAAFAALAGVGDPVSGEGIIYCAFLFRGLYGSARSVVLLGVSLLAAYFGAVLTASANGTLPAGVLTESLFVTGPTFVVVAFVMHLLASTLTGHEQLARTLREREERFRALVQNASDVILVLDADARIDYESAAVERVLGHRFEERVGANVVDLVHPADRRLVERELRALLQHPLREATLRMRLPHADGSWRVIEGIAKNLLTEPSVAGIVINYRDVTEREALAQQLTHQARHDPLTALPNRTLLRENLQVALARAARRLQSDQRQPRPPGRGGPPAHGRRVPALLPAAGRHGGPHGR